jgi:His-Xaa-Ser system protein HxsD
MIISKILEAAAQRPLKSDEIECLKMALQPEKQAILSINPNLYPMEAVHRVLYWFAEEAPLYLEVAENNEVVILTKEPIELAQLPDLQKRLLVALNDFTVRLDIEQKTTSVREALIQTAFSGLTGKTPRNAS